MNTTAVSVVIDSNILITIIGKKSPFRWIFDCIIQGKIAQLALYVPKTKLLANIFDVPRFVCKSPTCVYDCCFFEQIYRFLHKKIGI